MTSIPDLALDSSRRAILTSMPLAALALATLPATAKGAKKKRKGKPPIGEFLARIDSWQFIVAPDQAIQIRIVAGGWDLRPQTPGSRSLSFWISVPAGRLAQLTAVVQREICQQILDAPASQASRVVVRIY